MDNDKILNPNTGRYVKKTSKIGREIIERNKQRKRISVLEKAATLDVFLGGSSNPTTWRRDIAIPRLEKAGISYYNPQVDEWHSGLVEIENQAKAKAKVLLFVIDNVTRAIASIAEAAYYIGHGRNVVLVIQYFKETDFTAKNGTETVNGIRKTEMKDLNRGRTYLEDIAKQRGVHVFEKIDRAFDFITKRH